MVDGVRRGLLAAVVVERFARVGVDVEAGEVAAGDVHTNAMPFFEDVRCGIGFDGDGIDFARLHQLFCFDGIAEAGADNAIADVEIETAGEIGAGRIDVDQLGSEVGIFRAGGNPEFDGQFAGHFQVFFERLGLEDDDIITG